MSIYELFAILDLNSDGVLSRTELHSAAHRLGWDWPQAPLFAVLDLLTTRCPLDETTFAGHMARIVRDPHGVFGQVLRSTHQWLLDSARPRVKAPDRVAWSAGKLTQRGSRAFESTVSLLREIHDNRTADRYVAMARQFDQSARGVSSGEGALLIVDPQHSFTAGAWMRSIGPTAETEVRPLRLAFDNCARLLCDVSGVVEFMPTKCPFPPDSYGWAGQLADVLDSSRPYIIKPGNSVLWPASNGFTVWVERLLERNKHYLIMGGCTLNSCLRVSAVETQRIFQNRGLEVIVDLSISGARASNYEPSVEFGGLSHVESAVREMVAAGVAVTPYVSWAA